MMMDAHLFVMTVEMKVYLSLMLSFHKHLERLCSGLCLCRALDLATSEGSQTLLVGNAREDNTVGR